MHYLFRTARARIQPFYHLTQAQPSPYIKQAKNRSKPAQCVLGQVRSRQARPLSNLSGYSPAIWAPLGPHLIIGSSLYPLHDLAPSLILCSSDLYLTLD